MIFAQRDMKKMGNKMEEAESREAQVDLETERQREYANEVREGEYDCWLRDNKQDLQNRYIEDNRDGFDEFCKNDYDEFKDDQGDKMEWLTYNRECGFNIVEAKDEESAENFDYEVLDSIEEVDEQIIKRIRELNRG